MNPSRRQFLAASAVSSAAIMVGGTFLKEATQSTAFAQETSTPSKYKTQIYKALIGAAPTNEICEKWKTAGYDGMEVTKWNIPIAEARENRLIAEKHDFYLHSIMRGWAEFNHKDESIAKKSIEETKHAIQIAGAYGAEAILLVPCRVGGMKMPEPWDFDIDFDPKTLFVKSVVQEDNVDYLKANAPYAEYIKAQNDSTFATIKAIEELIPVAAKEGVMITLENVWNNLWCDPEYAAALVRYFDNPWVKSYLDLGNHTKYSKPQLWIKAMGHTLAKLHIKGYKINEELGKKGGGKGDWCAVDQATINWKECRKLLDDYNYNGWISVEEGNYGPEKYNEILNDFIAG